MTLPHSNFLRVTSALVLCACNSRDARSGSISTLAQVAATSTPAVSPRTIGPGLGPLEIPPAAVLPANGGRSPGKWCTSFGDMQLSLGDTATLVWPDTVGRIPSIVTVVSRVRTDSACLFYRQDPGDMAGQDGDESYELTPVHPISANDARNIRPGIAVWGNVQWVRGPDHLLRADLDGDGNPEIARSCSTREAVNLTVWTSIEDPATGKPHEVRRWKVYQPLGFDDVPNCTERESEDGSERR